MEPLELSSSLASALARPGYGETVEEILETCRLAVMAEAELTNVEKATILGDHKISPQIWKRLLAVGKNPFFELHKERLPVSFSALYRLNLLGTSDYLVGVQDGSITPKITTREIDSYVRRKRVESTYYLNKKPVYLFTVTGLEQEDLREMLAEVNQVAAKYYAYFDFEDLEEIRKTDKHFQFNKALSSINSELEDWLDGRRVATDLALNYWDKKDDESISLMEIRLLGASLKDLTLDLMKLSKSRQKMMDQFGEIYIWKIVQQCLKADSRTQRYNYKRRLSEVAEKYPHLREVVKYFGDKYLKN